MIRPMLFLLAVAATPALGQNTMAPAPGADAAKKGAEAFAAIDTDKNGTIEKAEWTAAGHRDAGFDMFDGNADGKLTPEEIRAGIAKLRAQRGQ